MANYGKSRWLAIRNAFTGVKYVLKTQENCLVYAIATIAVVILSFWISIPIAHWGILILTISMVWAIETINTSIEILFNIISPSYHPLVKIGKDVSAGAVLIAAICSIIVGILILGPPMVHKLSLLF